MKISQLPLLLLASVVVWLPSCSNKKRGVPSNLPSVGLHAGTETPVHRMPPTEYPFAPNGDYVQAWAAAGSGGEAAESDDRESIRDHHSDSPPSRSAAKPKSVRKVADSPPKKKPTGTNHVVKGKDTLSSIARKYGTTVAKIKSANGLKSDLLRDGRTLIIPR